VTDAAAFSGMVVATFAISGGFELLAHLASGSILLVYFMVSLSVIRARQREAKPQEGEFSLPFGPVVPMLSMAMISWLFFQLTIEEMEAIGILVVLSIAAYGVKAMLQRRGGSAAHG
jgi:L-asparagine transporter-like permease